MGMILAWTSALPCVAGGQEKANREPPRDGRVLPGDDEFDGTRVTLSVDRSIVRVGDRLLVHVNITRSDDVGHVPFHIDYDATVLRFEQAVEGTFLNQDGNATIFLTAPNRSGDSVAVGLSRLGGKVGVAGDGELCRLAFRAIGEGDTRLGFSQATVRDGTNREVPVEFHTTTIVVR